MVGNTAFTFRAKLLYGLLIASLILTPITGLSLSLLYNIDMQAAKIVLLKDGLFFIACALLLFKLRRSPEQTLLISRLYLLALGLLFYSAFVLQVDSVLVTV